MRCRVFAAITLSLLLLACASTGSPAAGWRTVTSSSSTLAAQYRLLPQELTPAQLFEHGLFDLQVRLLKLASPSPPEALDLEVDAGMPEHRHGMNVVPSIERTGEMEWRVRGMLFHMPGDWTLTFDVLEGALVERLQCVLHVD